MTREWKPGDVAVGRIAKYEGRFVFRGEYDGWDELDGTEGGWDGTFIADLRPLVVIDPEDREQVERLVKTYNNGEVETEWVDAMQAALRSLIAPPKPPEPTGDWAVVADANGDRWLKDGSGGTHPWVGVCTGEWVPYAEIAAVRILSEGIDQ